MKTKKTLVVLVVAIALIFAALTPRPAKALSGGEITLIVVGSIAGFVGFIVLGTVLAKRSGGINFSEPRGPDAAVATGDRVHVGAECQVRDGTMPLLCW